MLATESTAVQPHQLKYRHSLRTVRYSIVKNLYFSLPDMTCRRPIIFFRWHFLPSSF